MRVSSNRVEPDVVVDAAGEPQRGAQVIGENGERAERAGAGRRHAIAAAYCSKLFSPLSVKHFGSVSLGPLLGALGLGLVVEIDHEQFERMKSRLG